MIKTITLDGLTSVTVKESPFDMARFCWIYNHSDSDVFASCVNSDCTENADGVLRVPAGETRMLDTESYETLYLNGSGTAEIITSAFAVCPFKRIVKGGDNTEYGENIFDFNAFRTKLSALPQPVMNGEITWLDNGFTLTASSADCYTWFADGTAPYFEVEKNTAYEISCDVSGDTGYIYIFFDYPPVLDPFIYYENTNTKFTFTTLSSTQKITLRFGVQGMGNSCTYSNIKIRKIL